jgi:hypothetical protein
LTKKREPETKSQRHDRIAHQADDKRHAQAKEEADVDARVRRSIERHGA